VPSPTAPPGRAEGGTGATVRRADSLARVPWRNGAGTTIELASGGGRGEAWGWRVSIADIGADGPFSAYPGVVRQILVVAGAGADLELPGGATIALEPGAAARFDGAAAPRCRLRGGPVRAFNVMTSAVWRADPPALLVGESVALLSLPRGAAAVLHLLAGSCTTSLDRDDECLLAPGDALLARGPLAARLDLAADASAAFARLSRRPRAARS
jgi:environmental stress-induced protein Ves